MSPAAAAPVAAAPVAPASPKAPGADAATPQPRKHCARPDATKYREQMDALNATIAQHKARLDEVHKQLPDYNGNGKTGTTGASAVVAPLDPVAAKRKELRTRLDEATAKRNQLQETRNTTLALVKQTQESMKKKVRLFL
jgi:hypothetical protein